MAATDSIFVSSVQKELAEERRAVKTFIESDPLLRRYFRIFLFEDLPACDRRADEVYLDEVDRSAVYVGIFGKEYGFEDAAGVSPTEREFDRATLGGKPRLIFVKGTDDRTAPPENGGLDPQGGRSTDPAAFRQHTGTYCRVICQPRGAPGSQRLSPIETF